MKKHLILALTLSCAIPWSNVMAFSEKQQSNTIRVATFNVSMEALNYSPRIKGQAPNVTGNELAQALHSKHQQIKNIAEIIQRINPDVILLNEFDYTDDKGKTLQYFLTNYLAVSQQNQPPVNFPYYYQSSVNTGVKTPIDLNSDGKIENPVDTYGFGYFPGHFGMVLLSKYPINQEEIKTFQYFKWRDMPNALKPINPETKKPWYSDKVWSELRLSSKSHWDIPLTIEGKEVHILASHPTPPVFDGPEDRNGKRNHDEIRFWHDYITPNASSYIYDDKMKYGGLKPDVAFVILGDQNASSVEGDAINSSIKAILEHKNIQDPMPTSIGGKEFRSDNKNAKHHTAYWGMRADYVLPSNRGWSIVNSGVFWPEKSDQMHRLIKDRQASSDHRLVWVDLILTKDK